MARNARQSKILEIIANCDIEKQEDLVEKLRLANFDITQATISRDIKELGLIKVMTENKKYRYAVVSDTDFDGNKKYKEIFKEAVLNIHLVNNAVVIKTIRYLASSVSAFLEKLGVENVLGSVFGDDTVNVLFDSSLNASMCYTHLNKIIYS